MSIFALAEATWALSTVYALGTKEQAKVVEMSLDHRNLVLQAPDTVATALALFRAKPALGFSDCLMLQLAQKAGHLPLGTFDRGFFRLDGTQRL